MNKIEKSLIFSKENLLLSLLTKNEKYILMNR